MCILCERERASTNLSTDREYLIVFHGWKRLRERGGGGRGGGGGREGGGKRLYVYVYLTSEGT